MRKGQKKKPRTKIKTPEKWSDAVRVQEGGKKGAESQEREGKEKEARRLRAVTNGSEGGEREGVQGTEAL